MVLVKGAWRCDGGWQRHGGEGGYAPKSFLPGSIPYLEPYARSVLQFYRVNFEVDPDRCDERGGEAAVREA